MRSCHTSAIGHPYSHCYNTMQNDRVRLVEKDFLATFPGLGELCNSLIMVAQVRNLAAYYKVRH